MRLYIRVALCCIIVLAQAPVKAMEPDTGSGSFWSLITHPVVLVPAGFLGGYYASAVWQQQIAKKRAKADTKARVQELITQDSTQEMLNVQLLQHSYTGCTKSVASLLEHGAQPLMPATLSDGTRGIPLYEAAKHNHKEFIQLCKEKDVLLFSEKWHIANVLLIAAEHGAESVVHYLVEDDQFVFNINCRDQGGQTPLFKAVAGGWHPLTDFLLKKGALPSIVDNVGKKPIDYATKNYIKQLFEGVGID